MEDTDAYRVSSYTPAQKRATLKYREQNKEAYNSYQREYHKEQMATNEDYRRRKAEAAARTNAKIRARKQAYELACAEEKIQIIYSDTNIDKELTNQILKSENQS